MACSVLDKMCSALYGYHMTTKTYTATSTDGRNYCTVTVTADEQAKFADMIEKFLTEGIARYGSVDEFTRALRWYNELKAAA